MSVELTTLNDALCIKDETVNNLSGNSLVNYFISIAVLAETAISKSDKFPWLIEKKLDKRRNAYEFDKHLQNMMLFLDGKDGISAKCIPCGSSGMYKSEIVIDEKIYVHFCHSFDKTAKYNEPYIQMNENSDELRFCCFEYSLTSDKTQVSEINLLIPRFKKNNIKIILNSDFQLIRERINKSSETIEKKLLELHWNKT